MYIYIYHLNHLLRINRAIPQHLLQMHCLLNKRTTHSQPVSRRSILSNININPIRLSRSPPPHTLPILLPQARLKTRLDNLTPKRPVARLVARPADIAHGPVAAEHDAAGEGVQDVGRVRLDGG
jgi:hypothetical protein